KELHETKLRLIVGEPVNRSELLSALGLAGVIRADVMSYLDSIYRVQAARQERLEREIQSKMAELLVKRAQIVSFLNEQFDLIVANIRNKLTPMVDTVQAKEKVVKIEAQKLGLAV